MLFAPGSVFTRKVSLTRFVYSSVYKKKIKFYLLPRQVSLLKIFIVVGFMGLSHVLFAGAYEALPHVRRVRVDP